MTGRTRTVAAPTRTPGTALLGLALAATTALTTAAPLSPAAAEVPLVDVVVTSTADGLAGVREAVAAVLRAGGTVTEQLPLVGGVSAVLPAGADLGAGLLVADDRPLQVAGDDDEQDERGKDKGKGSGGTTAVSSTRAALGLGAPRGEGAGVVVAVVDTGVADVPDLAGRVSHVSITGQGGDGLGHGTFVAGLVAGSGAASGGEHAGVAPAARILDVQVARADGSSNLSLVLQGLQAVADHGGVDVVNLSLSSGSPLPWQVDPLTRALESLRQDGAVVVVPSGNDASTISSPGTHPALLTVGGLDTAGTGDRRDDAVAAWSGRSTEPRSDAEVDLVAPGQSVVSLRAPGSVADTSSPSARRGNGYFVGTGTSFATALVSGAAAAVAGRGELTPGQVEDLLVRSAYKVKGDEKAAGAGGLDVGAALSAKPKKDRGSAGEPAPAWSAAWQALFEAVLDGDQQAAANSWAALTPADRAWVARNWTARNWTARNWTANSWAGLGWSATGGLSVDQWHALLWGAETWAARNWTARNWTADAFAARNWTDAEWAARNWTARNWTARNWTARNWTGDWAARNWTARNWSARNWSALGWS